MANVMFRYLYRDTSNYKKWGAVVFTNEEGLPVAAVAESLRRHFWPEGLFIASQVNLPGVFLFDDYPLNPDDHCFHEFDSVEATQNTADDRLGRSVSEFIREVESAGREGWEVFDPLEPFAQGFRVEFKRGSLINVSGDDAACLPASHALRCLRLSRYGVNGRVSQIGAYGLADSHISQNQG